MPWVRIHDGALTHPKIIGMSDKSFRLWVFGLSYAQQHLTDGYVPAEAIQPRLKRACDDLVSRRLWDVAERGFVIHDYLQWNDSRAVVSAKRDEAKGRMAHARVRSSQNVLDRTSQNVHERTSCEVLRGVGKSGSSFLEKGSGEKPDEQTAIQAGRFVERYQELFSELRKGAKYHPKPAIDWQRACDLLKTWDFPRLEKMAKVFLKTDDDWIANTDRGFGVFCARATWCDDRLRAVEKTPV